MGYTESNFPLFPVEEVFNEPQEHHAENYFFGEINAKYRLQNLEICFHLQNVKFIEILGIMLFMIA